MAFYETIYILRPDLSNEQVEQVVKRVGEMIEGLGGKILKTEMWGRRQLAYLVKKNNKGFYVFHSVEGGGTLVHELESKLRIDEDVIKFQNIRVEQAFADPTPLAPQEEPKSEEKGDEAEASEETTEATADEE
ncbi:30S ribosomal protein S6 [Magnetofaba australis]|uniref:Small ribosomal subunit protein bS6 n=1 Tax=Magnetofaba australis IT-1 TaxID=1434232 RepID=A0A1Y2K4I3_9PROT|nr:30S ribosomal protein S6 [Magnetofaba australis]OSM02577.1 putative 30S ribosomal protein S6 [Magnetofaba australis IT-1]